jgi:hypothetical protein
MPVPGGAVEVGSPFYLDRASDKRAKDGITRRRGLVTIRGPRQCGKTSLLFRVLQHCRERGCRVVFIDFQTLASGEMASVDALWRAIAAKIADDLRIEGWQTAWQTHGYERALYEFLRDRVFAADKSPLVLCVDEVDRAFGKLQGVFSSIRSFWGRGALPDDDVWPNLRWVLATSSEPRLFITNLKESPFNIGTRVELARFDAEDVKTLIANNQLALPWSVTELYRITGGQPYLTHLVLYEIARGVDPITLQRELSAGDGEFRNHLERFLVAFERDDALRSAMKQVLANEPVTDSQTRARLEAAGLVVRTAGNGYAIACDLYRNFFSANLGPQ